MNTPRNRTKASATTVMLGGTTLSRVLGFARDMLLAHLLGPAADAFLVAFRLPNVFRRLLAEGSLGLACTAAFSRTAATQGLAAARQLCKDVLVLVLLFSVPLTLILSLAAKPLVFLMAPGLAATPDLVSHTAALFQYCLPYLPLSVMAAIVFSARAGQGDFVPQALASSLFNVCMLLAGLFSLAFSRDILSAQYILCFSVALAGAAQLFILGWKGVTVIPAHSSHPNNEGIGARPYPGDATAQPQNPGPENPIIEKASPGKAREAVLTAPAAAPGQQPPFPGLFRHALRNTAARAVIRSMPLASFGASVHQLQVLVGVFLASLLAQGSISALYFAERLFEIPLGLAGVAIAVAATPRLAELATQDDKQKFSAVLKQSFGVSIFLSLPAAAGLAGLALPLAWLFFGHGAYGNEGAMHTASCLMAYATGLPAMCAARPLLAALAALGESRAAGVAACQSLIIAVLFGLMTMSLGPAGIALGISAAAWCNSLLLLRILRRRNIPSPASGCGRRFLFYTLLSLIMVLALSFLPLPTGERLILAGLICLLAGGCAFLWVFLFWATGNTDARDLVSLLRR